MIKPSGSTFFHCRAVCVLLQLTLFCAGAFFFWCMQWQNAAMAETPRPQGNAITLGGALRAQAVTGAQPARAANTAEQAEQTYDSWSIFHRDSNCTANIYYPQLNNITVDSELYFWADKRLRSFIAGVGLLNGPGSQRHGSSSQRYSLGIDYSLFSPSANYISVIFKISTDMGGDRPDEGIATFTYDLHSGRLLSLPDIFADNAGLLDFFSDYSREILVAKLGTADEALIIRGTAPRLANFEFFALTQAGLDIYFPPYQVANSNWGEQKVSVPLKLLAPYQPRQEIWGRKGPSFPLTPQ